MYLDLSIAWDRIHTNCPRKCPVCPVLPATVPRDPKPVSNQSRANRKRPEASRSSGPMTGWLDKVGSPSISAVYACSLFRRRVRRVCVLAVSVSAVFPMQSQSRVTIGQLTAATATRPGLEQLPSNTRERALSENGGHPGGQFGNDSDLVAIIGAWPGLSDAARRKILKIARRGNVNR